MKKVISISAISILLALAGCEKKDEHAADPHGHDDEAPVAVAVDAHGEAAPAAHMEAPVVHMDEVESDNTGKVIEFSNVPGYTYALVSTHDGDKWFAGPSADLTEGQTVYWTEGAMMSNFHSKALDMTFDGIMFIDHYLDAPAAMAAANPHGGDMAPAAGDSNGKQGKVVFAQVSAGYLYLEVDTADGHVWIASPSQEIHEGEMISWANASEMTNFTSKSLGRTFETILFASGVKKI